MPAQPHDPRAGLKQEPFVEGVPEMIDNFRFYFPLTTCILLSLVLTGIIWLVRHFSR